MTWWLIWVFTPIFLGWLFARIGQKCTGKSARTAFNSASWGFYLLLLMHLMHLPFQLIPFVAFLNLLIYLTPSAICFLIAGNSMLKEMKAQRVGEYTDVA